MDFKIIDCQQGGDEWHKARLGKITASVFSKVITKTGKLSASAEEIVNRAVAEIIVGEPDETFQTDSMLRGQSLELEALEYFNFTYGYKFVKCGFIDSGKGYGVSPDGIDLPVEIGLELKCPEAHTHLSYLASKALPDKYMQQVQGAMYVTGFESWVFGSYHPDLPCFSVVVKRDPKIMDAFNEHLPALCKKINDRHLELKELIGAQ